jgi:hypothetical protein
MDQVSIKYTIIFQCKTLQNLPEFGFFGLKTNHLATLPRTELSYICSFTHQLLCRTRRNLRTRRRLCAGRSNWPYIHGVSQS